MKEIKALEEDLKRLQNVVTEKMGKVASCCLKASCLTLGDL
jgi:hypothetical protein